MTTSAVSSDVVALVLGEGDISGEDLQAAVKSALSTAGYRPWRDIEAEVYTYGSSRLLIARPSPPLTKRLHGPLPRLIRAVE